MERTKKIKLTKKQKNAIISACMHIIPALIIGLAVSRKGINDFGN